MPENLLWEYYKIANNPPVPPLAEWAKCDHSAKAPSRGGKNGQQLGGLLDDSCKRFATDALAPRSTGLGKKDNKWRERARGVTIKGEKENQPKKPFKMPPSGVTRPTKEFLEKWKKIKQEQDKYNADRKAKKEKNKLESKDKKEEKKAEKEGKKVGKKT